MKYVTGKSTVLGSMAVAIGKNNFGEASSVTYLENGKTKTVKRGDMNTEKSVNEGNLSLNAESVSVKHRKDKYRVAEIREIIFKYIEYNSNFSLPKQEFSTALAKEINKFIEAQTESLFNQIDNITKEKDSYYEALLKVSQELTAIKGNEAKREAQIAKLEDMEKFYIRECDRLVTKYNDLKTDNELKTKILNRIFK